MVKLGVSRGDRIRAWVLIVLGIAMSLAGLAFAIHEFQPLDFLPMLGGVIAVLYGAHVLSRKRRP